MKKLNLAIVSVLTFTMAFSILSVFGTEIKPGSETDPLVTKSYVDKKINEALAGGTTNGTTTTTSNDEIVTDVIAQIEYLYGDKIRAELNSGGGAASAYVPVNVPAGKTIAGHEGTEIILRSGTATGFCPGQNGLVNTTNGKEIYNNENVDVNNMIIVPRNDGRGVKATTDAWFMVKGGYEIK